MQPGRAHRKDVTCWHWEGFILVSRHTDASACCVARLFPSQYVRTQQAKFVAQFVRAKRSGQGKPKAGYPHLSSYKQDAPWRGQPASDKQLEVLKRLGVRAGQHM
jgi:hypothetical protein